MTPQEPAANEPVTHEPLARHSAVDRPTAIEILSKVDRMVDENPRIIFVALGPPDFLARRSHLVNQRLAVRIEPKRFHILIANDQRNHGPAVRIRLPDPD